MSQALHLPQSALLLAQALTTMRSLRAQQTAFQQHFLDSNLQVFMTLHHHCGALRGCIIHIRLSVRRSCHPSRQCDKEGGGGGGGGHW